MADQLTVKQPSLSIVVPILNELAMLRQQQDYFAQLSQYAELVFVDGQSDDGSFEFLAEHFDAKLGASVLRSSPGRATQLNIGAFQAKGALLLFHHVDSRISFGSLEAFSSVPSWGYFPVRLNGRHWLFRAIEAGINLRSRLSGIATGDQCIYVQRALFDRLGGYADIALMEDVELCRRLRKQSKPQVASDYCQASSRRWEQKGIVKTQLLMWRIQLMYWCGQPIEKLAALYTR